MEDIEYLKARHKLILRFHKIANWLQIVQVILFTTLLATQDFNKYEKAVCVWIIICIIVSFYLRQVLRARNEADYQASLILYYNNNQAQINHLEGQLQQYQTIRDLVDHRIVQGA